MLFVLAAAEPTNPYAPWGTHLAFGNDPTTDMSVMWSTRLPPASAVVDVTLAATGATTRFPASSRVFSDANNTQTLHRAFMTGLAPGGHYTYVVGDGSASVVSSVTTSGNPPTTTFNYQNIDPQTGNSWRDSMQDFGRSILFANETGIFGLYAGGATKISAKLDQIFG